MAININQLNPQGLAQLAGNTTPNYNLPLFGDTSIPNKALFEAAQAKALLAQQQAELAQQKQMGIFEQEQMNKRNTDTLQNQIFTTKLAGQNQMNVANLNAGIDREKMAQDQRQFGQTLGLQKAQLGADIAYKQGSLENEQQKTAVEKMKAELEARAKMTEQERNDRSAAAGAYLIERQKIQDPQQADGFDHQYMKMLVDNKIMSQEQADRFLSAPPEMRSMLATQDYLLTQKASEYAKLAGGTSGAGGVTITQPDGTIVQVQRTTKPVQTQLQTDIKNNLTQLDQLENIGSKFAKDYLTYGGKIKNLVGGIGSSLGLEEGDYQKFSENRAGFTAALDRYALEFVKAMSGVQYSDKQLEAMKAATISSSDNPAEFKGKFKQLVGFMRANLQTVQEIAKEGIPVGSPDFQSKFDDRVSKSLEKVMGSSDVKVVPMSEIQQVMEAKGMTKEQVEQTYNVRGE